ncbi:hypothetical protein H0H93_013131 [Arthromyces matolae]|nr:hypothetical protein H0H93_013131 [Arthromyces matolae]
MSSCYSLSGVNLQFCLEDHVSATYTVQAKPGLETWTRMDDAAFAKTQSELFKSNGSGMLSGLPVAYAFLPLKDFDEDGKLARLAEKLSLAKSPVSTLQMEWLKDDRVAFLQLGLNGSMVRLAGYDRFMPGTLQTPEPGVNYISSSVILLHPFFKGSVHISSNDPTAAPVIDHNYLDNEFDVQVLVEGYKLIRKIYENAPLKDLVDHEVSPGPAFQSDAELAEYAKKVIGSTYHPIATASMLPREDGGVVDERLKVYGTANLRVVSTTRDT